MGAILDLDKLHDDDKFFCKDCQGTEYVTWEDEKGYRYAKPCSCSIERRFIRTLRVSRLPREEYLQKRLENFKEWEPWQKEMKDLALQFIADPEARGIGFFGNSGTGKTFICVAICLELLRQGKIHKYFSYRREVNNLLGLKFDNSYEYRKEIQMWSDVPYLYIDDLWKNSTGENGTVSRAELQVMYEIINNRYIARKVTIFSSEYIISKMRNIDDALASRIYEMCVPYGYTCKGDNQRFVKRGQS